MNEEKALHILKSAILLEKKGEVFYQKVADQSKIPDVRKFFQDMADDEKQHVAALKAQFEFYQKHKKFDPEINQELLSSVADEVLNPKLKELIESASYEAAAISAAIDFEKKAVELYGNRAKEASDPEERKLFSWLSEWEQGHLDAIVKLDEQLQEKVWFDNGFWPS